MVHDFHRCNWIGYLISDANYVYVENTFCQSNDEIIDVYMSLQDAKDGCSNYKECKCIGRHLSYSAQHYYYITTKGKPASSSKGSVAWGKSKWKLFLSIWEKICIWQMTSKARLL